MSEEKRQGLCKFFVLRKKRYCKMLVKEGQEFCGEHQKISDVANLEVRVTEEAAVVELTKIRIVCPLDRKHTCYAHNLKKHLKICNARENKLEPHISKGINSGKTDEEDCDDSYKVLSTFSSPEILNVVAKVIQLYDKHIKNRISEKILRHEVVEEELKNPKYGDKTKKHLKQASAILGLLKEHRLNQEGTCYIEFGAGRGQLSFWIAQATQEDETSKILLVERSSPKHKRDNKLAYTSNKVERKRADISDLMLDKLDIINEAKCVVGVTKHLCGVATDLAIRCMGNMEINKAKLSGAVLTFCCHHQCRWIPYTGKEFFNENELTKKDFEIMCGIASWATCGNGFSRERRKEIEEQNTKLHDKDRELGLTNIEKEEIGRKSKNVLNWGRLVYLEKLGFNCDLYFYTERSITLENVCIVASK